MTSSGNLGDAALKIIAAETLDKNSSVYQENLSKMLQECFQILEHVSVTNESNEVSLLNMLKIRAHKIRIFSWNGSINQLDTIQESCYELEKLEYSMNNDEMNILNAIRKAVHQSMNSIANAVNHLTINDQ